MDRPTLVIMAAGMGSRFGGLKQITPVDDHRQVIMDYSIYDALRAGFGRVVCVIKPEMEADFRAAIGARMADHVELCYAHQTLERLPVGYHVPQGREKPWGTAHAVLCAAEKIPGAFAAINADDFYGRDAFAAAADFLTHNEDEHMHAMVGYRVENTLTENGYVSRGICTQDANGMLSRIDERLHIEPREGGAAYIEDGCETFIPTGTCVSMNMWAFHHSILPEMQARFIRFLETDAVHNPLKAEYFLPAVPGQLIAEKRASVRVLHTDARWYGVTYAADLARVQAAIKEMRARGDYPRDLWA